MSCPQAFQSGLPLVKARRDWRSDAPDVAPGEQRVTLPLSVVGGEQEEKRKEKGGEQRVETQPLSHAKIQNEEWEMGEGGGDLLCCTNAGHLSACNRHAPSPTTADAIVLLLLFFHRQIQRYFSLYDKTSLAERRRWRLGCVVFKGVRSLSGRTLSMSRFEGELDQWIRQEAEDYADMLATQHSAQGLLQYLPQGSYPQQGHTMVQEPSGYTAKPTSSESEADDEAPGAAVKELLLKRGRSKKK